MILLLFSLSSNAQILRTKEAILSDSKNYSTGIDNKGNEYLYYDEELPGMNGGTVNRTTLLYFLKNKNDIEICSHSKVITPSSEAPLYINWLDEKMEKVDPDRWRDPLTNYIYLIDTIEPFFIILISRVSADGKMPTRVREL